MRKWIVIAVLGYLLYSYQQGELTLPFFESSDSPVISNDNPAGIITITQGASTSVWSPNRSTSTPSTSSQYRCDGRQHCSQMRSYDEAVFFLRHCPNTKMDGDGDGIPCERQFGR